jgi:hypothetical protein
VVDCRTISEPSTPASRGLTPVPLFDGLHRDLTIEAIATTFNNESNLDSISPGSPSPTPTPDHYGNQSAPSITAALSTEYHYNHDEIALDSNLDRMRTLSLLPNSEFRVSGISRVIRSDDVHDSWHSVHHNSKGWHFSELELHFSRCKDITNQYIQERPDPHSAKIDVLGRAWRNELYIPQYIVGIPIIRAALQYWMSLYYDIEERDMSGRTFLLRACTSSDSDYSMYRRVTAYIEIGASVHSTDLYEDCGPIHMFMSSTGSEAYYDFTVEEVEEILILLLEAGCNPHALDSSGKSPLDSYEHPEDGWYLCPRCDHWVRITKMGEERWVLPPIDRARFVPLRMWEQKGVCRKCHNRVKIVWERALDRARKTRISLAEKRLSTS